MLKLILLNLLIVSASVQAAEVDCRNTTLANNPIDSKCFFTPEGYSHKVIYRRVKDSFSKETGIQHDGDKVVWFDKTYSKLRHGEAEKLCSAKKGMRLPISYIGSDVERNGLNAVIKWNPSGLYWGSKVSPVDNPVYDYYVAYKSGSLEEYKGHPEDSNFVRCERGAVEFEEHASGKGGKFTCKLNKFAEIDNGLFEFDIKQRTLRFKRNSSDLKWIDASLPENIGYQCVKTLWDNLDTESKDSKVAVFYKGLCQGYYSKQYVEINRFGDGSGYFSAEEITKGTYNLTNCKYVK